MKTIILFISLQLFLCLNLNSQWNFTPLNSGTTNTLTSGSQVNMFVTWVCGNNGTVIRTINSGYNWITANGGLPSNISLVNIFAIDSLTALTAGNIGSTTYLYRTSNRGNNWSTVFSQVNGNLNAIWMRTATTGIIVGNPVGGRWSIWKTINGGLNWDSTNLRLLQAGTETGFNNSLFCYTDNIWFGTNNSRIYHSTNYGINWVSQTTGSVQNIYSIYFYRGNSWSGLAGGSLLLETTNSGTNWVVSPNQPYSGNIYGINEPNPGVTNNIAWFSFIIRLNKVFICDPGPTHWDTAYTGPTNFTNLFHVFWEPNNGQVGYTYVLGANGFIARCDCSLAGINYLGNQIPKEFQLFQNYPNPFNPATKIKFDIPLSRGVSEGRGVSVSLKIFDILGREVATLVNEKLQPGSYEVEFNGTNYPSGVYFYKLQTETFNETKKLVLIK